MSETAQTATGGKRTINLKRGETLRIQTTRGYYMTLKGRGNGQIQVINYLAPLLDWHGRRAALWDMQSSTFREMEERR